MPGIAEGIAIVEECRQSGIEVRLVGSLAVGILTGDDLSARPAAPKDVDVVALATNRANLQRQLAQRGWSLLRHAFLAADTREQYERDALLLDVFYDGIDGNHRIDLRRRIELQYPTITAVDLLLSKLQRVNMRDVDVWDVGALLRHAADRLDLARWCEVLRNDWGLYTTAMDNLEKWSCEWPASISGRLSHDAKTAAKTFGWLARRIIGRRIRWWTPVYAE